MQNKQVLAVPVQEPVAWFVDFGDGDDASYFTRGAKPEEPNAVVRALAFFDNPPAARRQWAGLTKDERTEIRREHCARTLPLMDAVEAKLKEKNT